MADYPARIQPPRVTTFDHIESLEQIKPPYPAKYSAEWHALRKRVVALIENKQAKHSAHWSDRDRKRYQKAYLLAAGDDTVQLDYERNGFTREQWLTKWPGRSTRAMLNPGETLKDIPR